MADIAAVDLTPLRLTIVLLTLISPSLCFGPGAQTGTLLTPSFLTACGWPSTGVPETGDEPAFSPVRNPAPPLRAWP